MALMVSNCLVAVLILLVKAAFMPRRVAALVGAMLMITGRTTLTLSLKVRLLATHFVCHIVWLTYADCAMYCFYVCSKH
jgi:hypothetical protein